MSRWLLTLAGLIASAPSSASETWACKSRDGREYEVSQNVPSDKCKQVGVEPAPPRPVRPAKKVSAMEEPEFCVALGKAIRVTGRAPSPREAEILQRGREKNPLRPDDIEAIRKRAPAIGMTFCSVFAALGVPTRSHQSARASGTTFQLVYSSETRNTTYLHLDYVKDNYRVTSWSN